jgi:hypothetical protein
MNASVRRAVITVADALIEGADMTTGLIGGAIGAWAGYTYYPETWSGDWRLAATGAIAVIGALAINSMAGVFITPLRRLIGKARRPLPSINGRTAPEAPATLVEGLAQVATATADDAAQRAAEAAWRIDRGDNFLRDDTRWQGCEDGEAFFYLAPGVWLHYRTEQCRAGHEPHFSLFTGDNDQPVTITSLGQIHHRLAARVAGLPVAADAQDVTELHTV